MNSDFSSHLGYMFHYSFGLEFPYLQNEGIFELSQIAVLKKSCTQMKDMIVFPKSFQLQYGNHLEEGQVGNREMGEEASVVV